jgi:DNA ligase D
MGRFGPRPADGAGRRRKKAGPRGGALVYYAFDLLHHDGRSLLDVPLEQRKRLLRSVLREHAMVRYGAHVDADGEAFHTAVQQQGLEGVIAKLRSSRYEPGRRSKAWLKIKIRREQEAVVVGYEPGKGTHKELGSLILAVHDEGEWRYVGEVGSGLDARTRAQLKAELDEHARNEPPVVNAPRIKGARWSEPRLVVRVDFAEWTSDGLLRQAAYKGIDIGKDPHAVGRERAAPVGKAVEAAEKAAARQKPTQSARAQKSVGRKSEGRKSAGRKSDAEQVAGLPQAATAAELAALEEIRREGNWQIGGRTIRLTNLEKVLFPEPGFTKRDLIRYYVRIAPVMLPYLRGRPLNLWRWPDGVTGKHFWQKEIPSHAPEWLGRWSYPEAGSSEAHTYIVPDQVATMAWLANHATIDMHPWTSRTDAYKSPTYALVDIDPGTQTTWDEVVQLAKVYRAALEHLGVIGLPKVTGKRGIQVWVPIEPKYSFADTRDWVEQLSRAVGATLPELVSWEWEKSSRKGRARLDYTQNAVNKTLVAPYAVRPVAAAAVSAPIEWDELDDAQLRPDRWNIASIFERLEQKGDLFRPALEVEQELPPVG